LSTWYWVFGIGIYLKSAQILYIFCYETTPKWHGFLMINLVALVAGLNSEPQNIE